MLVSPVQCVQQQPGRWAELGGCCSVFWTSVFLWQRLLLIFSLIISSLAHESRLQSVISYPLQLDTGNVPSALRRIIYGDSLLPLLAVHGTSNQYNASLLEGNKVPRFSAVKGSPLSSLLYQKLQDFNNDEQYYHSRSLQELDLNTKSSQMDWNYAVKDMVKQLFGGNTLPLNSEAESDQHIKVMRDKDLNRGASKMQLKSFREGNWFLDERPLHETLHLSTKSVPYLHNLFSKTLKSEDQTKWEYLERTFQPKSQTIPINNSGKHGSSLTLDEAAKTVRPLSSTTLLRHAFLGSSADDSIALSNSNFTDHKNPAVSIFSSLQVNNWLASIQTPKSVESINSLIVSEMGSTSSILASTEGTDINATLDTVPSDYNLDMSATPKVKAPLTEALKAPNCSNTSVLTNSVPNAPVCKDQHVQGQAISGGVTLGQHQITKSSTEELLFHPEDSQLTQSSKPLQKFSNVSVENVLSLIGPIPVTTQPTLVDLSQSKIFEQSLDMNFSKITSAQALAHVFATQLNDLSSAVSLKFSEPVSVMKKEVSYNPNDSSMRQTVTTQVHKTESFVTWESNYQISEDAAIKYNISDRVPFDSAAENAVFSATPRQAPSSNTVPGNMSFGFINSKQHVARRSIYVTAGMSPVTPKTPLTKPNQSMSPLNTNTPIYVPVTNQRINATNMMYKQLNISSIQPSVSQINRKWIPITYTEVALMESPVKTIQGPQTSTISTPTKLFGSVTGLWPKTQASLNTQSQTNDLTPLKVQTATYYSASSTLGPSDKSSGFMQIVNRTHKTIDSAHHTSTSIDALTGFLPMNQTSSIRTVSHLMNPLTRDHVAQFSVSSTLGTSSIPSNSTQAVIETKVTYQEASISPTQTSAAQIHSKWLPLASTDVALKQSSGIPSLQTSYIFLKSTKSSLSVTSLVPKTQTFSVRTGYPTNPLSFRRAQTNKYLSATSSLETSSPSPAFKTTHVKNRAMLTDNEQSSSPIEISTSQPHWRWVPMTSTEVKWQQSMASPMQDQTSSMFLKSTKLVTDSLTGLISKIQTSTGTESHTKTGRVIAVQTATSQSVTSPLVSSRLSPTQTSSMDGNVTVVMHKKQTISHTQTSTSQAHNKWIPLSSTDFASTVHNVTVTPAAILDKPVKPITRSLSSLSHVGTELGIITSSQNPTTQEIPETISMEHIVVLESDDPLAQDRQTFPLVTIRPVMTKPLNFRITGVMFTKQLEDSTSEQYRTLEKELKLTLNKMFSTMYGSAFLQSAVQKFLNGSVLVETQLLFNSQSPTPSYSHIVRTVLTNIYQQPKSYFGWYIDASSVESNGYTIGNLDPECIFISFVALRIGAVAVGQTSEFNKKLLENLRLEVIKCIGGSFSVRSFNISSIRDLLGDLEVEGNLCLDTRVHTDVQSLLPTLMPLVNKYVDLSSITVDGKGMNLQVFPFSFRVTNIPFRVNLLDLSSSEFQDLSKNMSAAVLTVLKSSNPIQVIIREVLSGSLVCKGNIIYQLPAPGSDEVLKIFLVSLGNDGIMGASSYKVDLKSLKVGGISPDPHFEYVDFPGFAVAIIVMCGLCILIFPALGYLCFRTRMLGHRNKATIQRRSDPETQSQQFEMDNRAFRASIEHP